MNALSSYLAKSWRFRFLAAHLVGSDLRSRFRRSHLGILWAMIQPMMLALLFSVVLAKLFNQPFREQALYVFLGMVVWDVFAAGVSAGSVALINVEGFLRQSKIPLLVFHVRAAMNNLVICVLGFVGFSAFCLVIAPDIFTPYWLLLPFLLAITFVFTVPIIIVSSIINLLFRDYQQGIGVALQGLWYVSPAFIPRHVFEAPGIVAWTNINPAASLLDMYRDPLLYQKLPELHDFGVLLAWGIGFSLLSVFLLMRYERRLIFFF